MKTSVTFFIAILFGATFYLQTNLINSKRSISLDNPECSWCESQDSDQVAFLPVNTLFLRLPAPADPDFISDLLWLRTAYYFGSHVITDKDYPYLSFLLNRITDLSPKWELPYLSGTIMLFVEADRPLKALALIEKGIQALPETWDFLFLKGYILWKQFNDFERASKLLFDASQLEGAPPYLALLSARLAKKTGKEEFISYFSRMIDETIDNPLQKEMMKERLKE